MSGDSKGGPVRRPRMIERPRVSPGPLADLKALVYELYLEAGAPSLDEITVWVAQDDGLPGAPERDTIHRIIRDTGLPPSQADVVAVVTALARAARWDRDDAAERARNFWVAARMDSSVGVPITQVIDPFALEVHRPITLHQAGRLPTLPMYVQRAHDDRLAEVIVRATGGVSAMAVLVAGSSAGKTRACWEALEPLRQAGGWRLWHPYDPTRPQAALEALDRVRPRTVVWLNETQEYLRADGDGERVAAKLRSLLADPARAPVLVLGTLWPEHYGALTQLPGSQVRLVLEGTVIEVPDAFAGSDLAALKQAARTDARLALAAEHADDGQITQYLAGGPELIDRFRAAPLAAKALIWAAIDARRLGHRNALPHALLEEAAQAYLTDAQWDRLDEDWLEQALAYASRPCKGAQGPITRIRPRSGHARTRSGRRRSLAGRGGSEVVYRLADYLDQYGRVDRAGQTPPAGFWPAAAAHANPADLRALGDAAWDRGLYRDSAQLYKNATAHGDPYAACALIDHLHVLDSADHRPAHWATLQITLDDLDAVLQLLDILRKVGASEQVATLAERAAAHAPLDDPRVVNLLLRNLRRVGASEQVTVLLARNPAAHVSLDNPHAVGWLLDILREVGSEQVATLAERAAAHAPLYNPSHVSQLLDSLRQVGANEQMTVLLARSPAAHVSLDNPRGVGELLVTLREAGANEQMTVLLARNPAAHVSLDKPSGVGWLLVTLREAGVNEQMAVLLARNPAEHVPLDNPDGVSLLLDSLWDVGANGQTATLAERAATHTPLDNPNRLGWLVASLRRAGRSDQAATLAERAATHTPLDNPVRVGQLLHSLRRAGASEHVTMLTERAAAYAPLGPLDAPEFFGQLLDSLREAGANEQMTVLLARNPAEHVPLDNPRGISQLLDSLRQAGANEQMTVLLARNPAEHVPLDNPRGISQLLDSLRQAGANEQVATLAKRLPSAGRFDVFLGIGDHEARFRFGREPDMTAAPPWGWEDLE
ncbi:hypothetical protein GCM10023196_095020 [Actinoallomurus vinaceus]|uniref:ATP-binding protein n=1 Tax=Actinoallomurus vinaceus TaxID=1080074 RepID=A0ABP8URW1_9ACTN